MFMILGKSATATENSKKTGEKETRYYIHKFFSAHKFHDDVSAGAPEFKMCS